MITESFNSSPSAAHTNDETLLVIQGPHSQHLSREMDRLWENVNSESRHTSNARPMDSKYVGEMEPREVENDSRSDLDTGKDQQWRIWKQYSEYKQTQDL